MVRLIFIRELFDHMTSLRFALILLLLLSLSILNGLFYINIGYDRELEEYNRKVREEMEHLREVCDKSLWDLITSGPGGLYMRPSPLEFLADGGDIFPKSANTSKAKYKCMFGPAYSTAFPWRLSYSPSPKGLSICPLPIKGLRIDWVFIVGVVMSFAALALSFDAISAERESGTIRNVFSSSISRSDFILGKFLGAMVALSLPLVMTLLLNLLLINLSGRIPLRSGDWVRIGVGVVVSILYISIFVGLGLLISALSSRSSESLMISMLVWSILILLLPGALGMISKGFEEIPSPEEIERRVRSVQDETWKWFDAMGMRDHLPKRENPPSKWLRLWGEFLERVAREPERIQREWMVRQIKAISLAENLQKLSPYKLYRFAMESLAGTGFPGYRAFMESVWKYRDEFWRFVRDFDRSDPQSPHIYFVREGVSERKVPFEDVPKFKGEVGLGTSVRMAGMEILVLLASSALLFIGSLLIFLRREL